MECGHGGRQGPHVEALASLIEDKSIAAPTRMQLAFNCVSKAPAIIADPVIAAAVVPLSNPTAMPNAVP